MVFKDVQRSRDQCTRPAAAVAHSISSQLLCNPAGSQTSKGMDAGLIVWPCRIGSHSQAHTWVDCCPATSEALETIWANPEAREVHITEWPYHTFLLSIHEGRRNMVQRNNATGSENQLRKIIVVQIQTAEHFYLAEGGSGIIKPADRPKGNAVKDYIVAPTV